MKGFYLFMIFIFLPLMVSAANVPDDFWDKCPGPACPSNKPENPLDPNSSGSELWDRERIEREKGLLNREKYLLEREMKIREYETR